MGSSDRTLRSTAQPFLGQILGYNRNEQSDQSVDSCSASGDLSQLSNQLVVGSGGATDIPQQDNIIRIARPKSGQIVDAHFTMAVRTATAETNPYFKISVWHVTSATDLTRLTPSEATINQQMIALTGATTPFTNTAGQVINIDALNILSLLPQSTDSGYNEDFFTIGVHWYASNGSTRITPSNGTGYKLTKFSVEMSATVY